jgi:hypothetical protein
MFVPRFEPQSFMTERESSTNWAINHWQLLSFFYVTQHLIDPKTWSFLVAPPVTLFCSPVNKCFKANNCHIIFLVFEKWVNFKPFCFKTRTRIAKRSLWVKQDLFWTVFRAVGQGQLPLPFLEKGYLKNKPPNK